MVRNTSLFIIVFIFSFHTSSQIFANKNTNKALDVEDCVRIALKNSAKVEQSEALVKEYKARLAEVQSIFYPKLSGIGFIAPMFTVSLHDQTSSDLGRVERKYGLKDWGPYTRIDAILAQPIYSFGRISSGKKAAQERLKVEKARMRESKNLIALEVRKFYTLYLYAKSIQPMLKDADSVLENAIKKALEKYNESTGDITQVDIAKLEYGSTEIKKFIKKAQNGEFLALLALRHTMGFDEFSPLKIKDTRLQKNIHTHLIESRENLLLEASKKRPEWDQIRHGEKATLHWEDAEALANAPLLFVAGKFNASFTPVRDNVDNPYLVDPYNDIFGGIALGLKFDLDPFKANARSQIAHANHLQVKALKRFAKTGIPLQVIKAHTDLQEAKELVKLSKKGYKSAQKWFTFAATAFSIGTGEAKDILEGLVAYLSAKNSYYENLRDFYINLAELDYAVGHNKK